MAKRNLKRRLSEAQVKAKKWTEREREIDILSARLTAVSRIDLIKRSINLEKEKEKKAEQELELEFFFIENPEYFDLSNVVCEKTGIRLYSLPGELIKTTLETLGLVHGKTAIENLKQGCVHPLALFTDPASLERLFKYDTVGYMIYAASLLTGKQADIRGKIQGYKKAELISKENPQLIVHCAEMIRRALSLASGENWNILSDQASLLYLFESEATIQDFIEKIKTQYKAMLQTYCRKNKTRWIDCQIQMKTKIAFEIRTAQNGLFNFAKQKGLCDSNKLKSNIEDLVLELCDVLDLDLSDDSDVDIDIEFKDQADFNLISDLKDLDFTENTRKTGQNQRPGKVPFHLQVKKAELAQVEKKSTDQKKSGLTGLAALLAKAKSNGSE